MSLILIYPPPDSPQARLRLDDVLHRALEGIDLRILTHADELDGLQGKRLLFALPLGEVGINSAYCSMLARLRREPELLYRCTSGLVIDGDSELYTKSTATELALALTCAGSTLVGRPLVEGTGSLTNFQVQATLQNCSLEAAYCAAVQELAQRVYTFAFPQHETPNLVVLHASSHHTSNTMALWNQVKERLNGGCAITEIGLRNGTMSDCSGCPYTMCLHFGEKGECFYGGIMNDEVYPAVRTADAILLLCPNYNDALSANLTAMINRLTALFRQTRFYEKAVFAIVVSGYSGSDIVARQVISGMNMNKSFFLPSYFAMLETANHPGEALASPGIQHRLDVFTRTIQAALYIEDQDGNPVVGTGDGGTVGSAHTRKGAELP